MYYMKEERLLLLVTETCLMVLKQRWVSRQRAVAALSSWTAQSRAVSRGS
jgi:hypothetical protein